ncbi:MAG: hypothetical protein QOF98_1833, partial [Streptomyces sp.]|nr:hypothetical protein [Streptomyces sp.]
MVEAMTADKVLPERELAVLKAWAGGGGPLAVRARVVLLAAEGLRDAEISRRLGVSRQTVGTWRHRWQSAGLPGLEQRPRTGRPATVDEAEVVARALLAPGGSGASRAVARELGLSHATVAAIRRRWRLGGDGTAGPRVPARPPLPGADVWVMGLYADGHRAVLLAGTRPVAPPHPEVVTVIGEDVLTGLARALDAVRPAAAADTAGSTVPDLAVYLTEAAAQHPDIALHAITLWDPEPQDPGAERAFTTREPASEPDPLDGAEPDPHPDPYAPPPVTFHRLPVNATWRSFLRAMIALDSTTHPESSRRVYLDLIAALERRGGPVRWLRESVAGHLKVRSLQEP